VHGVGIFLLMLCHEGGACGKYEDGGFGDLWRLSGGALT